MIPVIPFAANDAQQAIALIEWIGVLAGGEKHKQVLLVVDAGVSWQQGYDAMMEAGKVFERVEVQTNDKPVAGWPQGPNSLFFTAAKYCTKEPWLWIEPDALPLRSGWLEEIEEAYSIQTQPFFGHIYANSKPEFPRKLMSGIGVYPPETSKVLFEVQAEAFDYHHADLIVSKSSHTPLIYHFWGQKDLAPTFAEFKTVNSPINEMVLESIPKEAVIFHRCKDGSLMQLLKEKQFPQLKVEKRNGLLRKGPLLVVLAFCGKDVELMTRNLEWIKELGGVKEYPCLLSYDDYTNRQRVAEVRKLAESTFREVKINAYRARNDLGWPAGANLAWQHTATFIQQHYQIPWLWIEADAVPIKSDWLDVLSAHYIKCGKSYFGPVVEERGHLNGVMIYPHNAAQRLPRAMSATALAWDYVCFPDMQSDHANAEPFIQHVWGWHDNRAHPHAGDAMRFGSVADVQRWVKPQAVLFHRAKDGSLIQQLRARSK